MNKHTPGPWKLLGPKKTRDSDGIESIDYAVECLTGGLSTGSIIVEIFHRTGENIFHDAEANAKLIASSPKLLTVITESKIILEELAIHLNKQGMNASSGMCIQIATLFGLAIKEATE